MKELAKRADVAIVTIKNIESRKHKSRREILKLILDALDLDISCDDYYLSLSIEKENLEEKDNSEQNVKNKIAEADKLFDEKKYEEALKIYSSLSIIYDMGEVYYNIGVCYYEENN